MMNDNKLHVEINWICIWKVKSYNITTPFQIYMYEVIYLFLICNFFKWVFDRWFFYDYYSNEEKSLCLIESMIAKIRLKCAYKQFYIADYVLTMIDLLQRIFKNPCKCTQIKIKI